MTYSLIIPIYNEIRTLPLLLKKLKELDDKIEIIIIDDGSNDGSSKILINNKKIKVINNRVNLGKGASIKKGLKFATKQNLILMDGDLEIDIEDIPRLITEYEKKERDILVGIRWKKNDKISSDVNILGNHLINSFFNFLFKSNLNDILCCVKIIDKKLFTALNIQSKGFSIESEIMSKIMLLKLSIKESRINYTRRTIEEGKKIKISDSLVIIWVMIKTRILGI
tara:strand:- start:3 stop:677 length:675 start_codon:yes stop_codon:yes gene_type:complete